MKMNSEYILESDTDFVQLFSSIEEQIIKIIPSIFNKSLIIEKKFDGGFIPILSILKTSIITFPGQQIKIYLEEMYNGHLGDTEYYLKFECKGNWNFECSANNINFPMILKIETDEKNQDKLINLIKQLL